MRNTNIKSLIIIILLVVSCLGTTYAYLNFDASAENAATGQGGCFEGNYSGQTINNASLSTTTDYTQGEQSEVTISKKADNAVEAENCKIYTEAEIKINTNTSTTAPISNGALKYKVIKKSGDGTIKSGGEGSITVTGETTLATVTLTETPTTYTVYLWIDSNLSLGYYNEKNYSGYIFATATQTSTIK